MNSTEQLSKEKTLAGSEGLHKSTLYFQFCPPFYISPILNFNLSFITDEFPLFEWNGI